MCNKTLNTPNEKQRNNIGIINNEPIYDHPKRRI